METKRVLEINGAGVTVELSSPLVAAVAKRP